MYIHMSYWDGLAYRLKVNAPLLLTIDFIMIIMNVSMPTSLYITRR